ncbi:DUF2520 domain-containing protein [bacterium SCSIO 12696]|nr:DUF2520 domain-containing protein [bacterium SCSIO 12696]
MANPIPTINIIGAGRLGKSLAKLWHSKGLVKIARVCNRSRESAQEATHFIGAGTAADNLATLPPATLWLVATADGEIEAVAKQLASHNIVTRGDVVFHCSGSLSSGCLTSLRNQGAHTASVHPIHSFADPQTTQQTFAGTHCACEGDEDALRRITPLFERIGGNTFTLASSTRKALYHSATVMACNYLVTLQESALSMLQQAGIERKKGLELLAPIVRQTADNIATKGTVSALTGPLARGDSNTIRQHIAAMQQFSPEQLGLYQQLGKHTLSLAQQQGSASIEQLQIIEQLLSATAEVDHE